MVDSMIMIHARRGVILAKAIDSAMTEVKPWKKDNCRVRRSIGLIASVLWAWGINTLIVPGDILFEKHI